MSMFWMIAALLALLVLMFAIGPLFLGRRSAEPATQDPRRQENVQAYRQQLAELEQQGLPTAEYERARAELDRMLLSDAGSAPAEAPIDQRGGAGVLIAGAVVALLVSVFLYSELGASTAISVDEQLQVLAESSDPKQRVDLIMDLLPQLERLADGDESGSYRFMLARLNMSLQRYPEAAAAYSELARMFPGDADVLAQYAQALFIASDSRMTPEVSALVERAAAINPNQVTLLGMLGMHRFQSGDFRGAIQSWSRLLRQLDPASPDAQVIRDGIAMAQQNLGDDAGDIDEAVADAAAPSTSADAPVISVSVALADGVSAPADATVFVFARAVSGPPMPLAVQRFSVAELPKTVTLSDEQAMMPAMSISRFEAVTVTARVSLGGQPTAQPGDFEGGGETVTVTPGTQSLNVLIDRQI